MEVSWSSQSELSEELTSSSEEPATRSSSWSDISERRTNLTLSNVQVGIVLVGEVGLQSSHRRPLLVVADGDKLVGVGAATCRLADNFTKLGEFLADLTERFRVQVEKGDAES